MKFYQAKCKAMPLSQAKHKLQAGGRMDEEQP